MLIWVVITQMYTLIKILLNNILTVYTFYLNKSILKFKNMTFDKIGLGNTRFTKIKQLPFLRDFLEPLRGKICTVNVCEESRLYFWPELFAVRNFFSSSRAS